MVVLGVDVHKRTHTAVAVDRVGRRVGERTVAAHQAGCGALLAWAKRAWPQQDGGRLWAIEDCRGMSGRLERVLLGAGEAVVRVPPHLTARGRRAARTRGKSDPIDALAVARAALADPHLPAARIDEPSQQIGMLVSYREHLVAERTAAVNMARWHLHQLDPGLDAAPRRLHTPAVLDAVTASLAEVAGLRARIAAELLDDIRALTKRIAALEAQLTARVTPLCPALLAIPGCGILSAAKILAETAGIQRFATEARYAAYAGTAPIPASSGATTRHRLNRGGNRQLNAAIHRIALTQTRLHGPGRAYYHRLQDQHHTRREAMRALKRKITRAVYHALKEDHINHTPTTTEPALT
jgi:transposase